MFELNFILQDRLLIQGLFVAVASIAAFPFLIWLGECTATAKKDTKAAEQLRTLSDDIETLHIIILVHGLQNTPKSMKGIQDALEKRVSQSDKNTAVVIHNSNSNVGKTCGGILPCGKRLAQEVNDLVSTVTNRPSKITLSFFGNSLGGLIARAALPDIHWNHIQPHIFCSTNSPHLGSKGCMIFPSPTWFEYMVSSLHGTSLMDLFRFTDCMEQLQHPKALQRLSSFQKRIAYATVHRTDFQVPTHTAVFLCGRNDTTHDCVPGYSQECPFVVQTFTTSKSEDESHISLEDDHDDQDWIDHHAPRLDAMGWTKVFCDVRTCLPYLPWFVEHPKDASNNKGNEWTSNRIRTTFCAPTPGRLYAPLAHLVFTAMLSGFTWRGQTVVHAIAARFMEDVLSEE